MTHKHTIFIADLLGSKILTAAGRHVGHVIDIQLTRDRVPQVKALIYGVHGWLYRWHVLQPFSRKFGQRSTPDTIPWEAIDKFVNRTVILKQGYEP